jgi:hypothetical protein
VNFGKTIVTHVDSMVGRTSCTAHAVGTPVTEGKMCKIVLFHFLLGWQLRIEHLSRSTNACFTMLLCDVAYCSILNAT